MKQHPSSNSLSTAAKQGMNRDSQVISKIKSKPRVIHIFAPEIIKTDEASFRDLVQQLTGKPSLCKPHKEKPNGHPPTKEQRSKNIQTDNDIRILNGERNKEESEEIFGGENSKCFLDLIELPSLPLKSLRFGKNNGTPFFK